MLTKAKSWLKREKKSILVFIPTNKFKNESQLSKEEAHALKNLKLQKIIESRKQKDLRLARQAEREMYKDQYNQYQRLY